MVFVKKKQELIVMIIGLVLFLGPFLAGWGHARSRERPVRALAFRGTEITCMAVGVHEGLSWLYVWGPALGLRRSLDNGRTWSPPLERELPPFREHPFVPLTFAPDPRDAHTLYLMLDTARGMTLYQMTDAAQWVKVRTFASSTARRLLMAPAEDGVYIAWGTTLWHRNGEGEWRILHKWKGTPIRDLHSLPGRHEIVFLLTDRVWRSQDGGNTWTMVGEEMGPVSRLQISLVPGGPVYALAATRVWRSRDGGDTWRDLHFPDRAVDMTVAPVYQNVLYVLDAEGRVWRHGPTSASWSVIYRGGEVHFRGIRADVTQPGRVYLFGGDGLWVLSEDLPEPTPTPTPSPTYTPTPTRPTPTPTFTPTATPSPTASPSPTFTATPTFTLTPTPSPTSTPSPTFTPSRRVLPVTRTPVTSTPTPTPQTGFTPAPTPLPTPTPKPTATPTPTAILSPTPPPTPTPVPTPTRTPGPPPER